MEERVAPEAIVHEPLKSPFASVVVTVPASTTTAPEPESRAPALLPLGANVSIVFEPVFFRVAPEAIEIALVSVMFPTVLMARVPAETVVVPDQLATVPPFPLTVMVPAPTLVTEALPTRKALPKSTFASSSASRVSEEAERIQ